MKKMSLFHLHLKHKNNLLKPLFLKPLVFVLFAFQFNSLQATEQITLQNASETQNLNFEDQEIKTTEHAEHLKFKEGALHIHADFLQNPVPRQKLQLKLETREGATHQLVDISEQITVTLWMPSMGHGAPGTKITPAVDAQGQPIKGTFIVNNVYFTMGGLWQVIVTLTDVHGNKESQAFEIDFKGSGGHHGH